MIIRTLYNKGSYDGHRAPILGSGEQSPAIVKMTYSWRLCANEAGVWTSKEGCKIGLLSRNLKLRRSLDKYGRGLKRILVALK